MSRTEVTRLAIIRAAERLFLERGMEHVSLREIAIAAGQHNPSAASYHFGDKRGLVEAILERHSVPIQTGWVATLNHAELERPLRMRELVTLLVRPIVAKADDADGGRAYLTLCKELITSTSIPLTSTRVASGDGALELSRRLMVLSKPVPPMLLTLRMMRMAAILYVSIADWLRMNDDGFDIPRDEFVDDLIDTIVMLLGSPFRAQSAAKSRVGMAPKGRKRSS